MSLVKKELKVPVIIPYDIGISVAKAKAEQSAFGMTVR